VDHEFGKTPDDGGESETGNADISAREMFPAGEALGPTPPCDDQSPAVPPADLAVLPHAQENRDPGGRQNVEIEGSLRQLTGAVEALRDDFRHSVRIYDHQRVLVDRLHEENEQLRRSELERARDPVVRDLISLADTCLRNGRAWLQREAVTSSDIDRVLREVSADVKLILQRQGVETFSLEIGTKFDRREARVVHAANTSNASQDGVLAEIFKPGYRIGDRVLRYCEVAVWAFVAPSTTDPTDAAEAEPNG